MLVKEIIANSSVWMPGAGYEDEKPLFSVILPTYSRAQSGYLQKCINSVLSQTLSALELLIVVDGSTDGSLDICKRYMEYDPRVSVIWHEHNMGLPAVSTYEAYVKARGDYITFVFDDNVWEPDALEKTYQFMEEKQAKASFGIVTVTDPVSKEKVRFGYEEPEGTKLMELLPMVNKIGAGSVVLHRDVLETVGLFDPHLAMTYMCNWDLWMRVFDHFPFVATNIPFSTDYGTPLPDSMESSFQMDQWFARERMQHRDTECLKAANYCDVDVVACSEGCSENFLQCLYRHYNQYLDKDWYCASEYEKLMHRQANKEHRYVLVYCFGVTASVMNFVRANSRDLTFCYLPFGGVSEEILARTDIVVHSRSLSQGIESIPLLKRLNIPCYYFVDDNFREIAKEINDPQICREAVLTTQEKLADYAGVIVTTETLRSYFLEKHLHEKVFVLNAVALGHELPKPAEKRPLAVGFMGGPFRMGAFTKCVLPALKSLAKTKRIRLVCPCTPETREQLLQLGGVNFEIIPILRTDNYERLLISYAEIGIDLLVHCGEAIRNNMYKTKNALLNAVALHVPLLVSDMLPYNDTSDGSEGAYQIIPNQPEAWKTAIYTLMNDSSKRAALYEKAAAFCKERYQAPVVWKELAEEFINQPWHDTFCCYKRYEQMLMRSMPIGMFKYGMMQSTQTPYGATEGGIKAARKFDPALLCYSGKIRRRTYGFTSQTEQIRTIGLLFAVTGSCNGEVMLTFKKRNRKTFATITLPIDELVENNYTLIQMPSSVDVLFGERLYVEIKVKYEKNDGYVGVFENKRYRTFGYKVMNKLKCPVPGCNALFVDCRG